MQCSCLNHLFLTIPIRFPWDSIRFNHFPGSIGPPWPKHHRDRRCAQRAWHFAPSTPWCYLPPAVAMLGAKHGKMLGTWWKPARNEDFTEKNDGQCWFPPRIWIYGIYGWIMPAKLVSSSNNSWIKMIWFLGGAPFARNKWGFMPSELAWLRLICWVYGRY